MLSRMITVPHLHGVFVSITSTTALWTETQWRRDIQSMKDVGMSFFVVARGARGSGAASSACPSGTYEAYFPLPSECFTQIGDSAARGGTVGNILRAAHAVGLDVHLGLALQTKLTNASVYPWFNATRARDFGATQWQIARQLWAVANGSDALKGFYTEIEESNNRNWLAHMYDFATAYFEPLAHDIKTSLRADLLVWASPYAVFNRTKYSAAEWVQPAAYTGMWEQAFIWAPSFDLVAQQDSMGVGKNSFGQVRDNLANLSAASARQGRAMWSNVELFEAWPPSCEWPAKCPGRHPAPFERIRAQLANEAPLVGPRGKLIAWEWTSCLSPHGGASSSQPWANETKANYEAYARYVAGGDAGAASDEMTWGGERATSGRRAAASACDDLATIPPNTTCRLPWSRIQPEFHPTQRAIGWVEALHKTEDDMGSAADAQQYVIPMERAHTCVALHHAWSVVAGTWTRSPSRWCATAPSSISSTATTRWRRSTRAASRTPT